MTTCSRAVVCLRLARGGRGGQGRNGIANRGGAGQGRHLEERGAKQAAQALVQQEAELTPESTQGRRLIYPW